MLLLVSLSALSRPALGQDAATPAGFDAHGFVLHAHDGDIRDPLTLDRPGPWSQGDWWLTGLAEYADSPLVQIIEPTQGTDTPGKKVIVDQLFALNLDTGVAVHNRVRLDASAPVYFTSVGPDGPNDPAFGDIRFTTMVALVRPLHIVGGGGPGLGLSGHLDIPSGDTTIFLGQPGVAGGLALSGTWEGRWFTATGELGTQLNPKVDLANITNSHQLVAGGALNVLPGPTTGITLESHIAAPFSPSNVEGTASPAELLLSLRQQFGKGVAFTVGGATALSEGVGAASFRVFGGLTYGQIKPARVPDADPVADARIDDRCPNKPETQNGWKDDDGCPDELGSMVVRATYKGLDVDDAELVINGPEGEKRFRGADRPSLKAVPGSAITASASAPALCLYGEATASAGESASELAVPMAQRLVSWVEVEVVDTAGAPIPNPTVRWSSAAAPSCLPDTPPVALVGSNIVRTPTGLGTFHVLVEAPGFKVVEQDVAVPPSGARIQVKLESSRVVLEATRIVILDKVFFETNKAIIKPASFQLLDDVAAVILAHPEVGRVQVEGHTDDQGNDAYNLKLSQSRADSVRAYLIKRGVAPERLVGVGFGETVPVDTNKTDAGRANNRRVEFKLIDQDAGGKP